MKKFLKSLKKIDKNYCFIFFISIMLLCVFISDRYVYAQDASFHLTNIEILKNMFSHFNFSKIVNISARGFGYGTSIFYPRFPHYLTAIIFMMVNQVGINGIFNVIKIAHFLIIFFSGFYMYNLLKYMFKNKKIALVCSIIYITMPYFLTDIYVRGAYNETFLFVLMPMIFLGLMNLINKDYKKFYFNFTIGYILLINSHLVLAVFYTFFLCIFLLFKIKTLNWEMIKKLIISSIIILLICSPELIILIQHKSLNLYTVFNSNLMGATVEHIKYYSFPLKNLIFPIINAKINMYGFINVGVEVLIIIEIIKLIKKLIKKEKIDNTETTVLILTILSFIMCLEFFPYQIFPKLLLSVQFAFRFLLFLCFFSTISAAYALNSIPKIKRINLIYFIIVAICLIMDVIVMHKVIFANVRELKYDMSYDSMGYQKEYLPSVLTSDIDYLKTRSSDVLVIEGSKNVDIKIIEHATPYIKFKVSNVSSITKLELPNIYYLGYDIKAIDRNKNIEKLKYDYSKKGFIEISVDKDCEVVVKYKGTMLYNVFRIVRIVTILFIFFILFKNRKNLFIKS